MKTIKHYNNIFWRILLPLFFTVACSMDGDVTNELTDYQGEDPHQISIIGYMCNIGAVVEVQKAKAPYNPDSQTVAVSNVSVQLISKDQNASSTNLLPYSETVFYTPPDFNVQQNVKYYLKVTAPGYDNVTSIPQKLPKPFTIDSIQLVDKMLQTFPSFDPDTILPYIFGQKTYYDVRSIYSIKQKEMTDGGSVMTIYSNGNTYRKKGYKYFKSYLPMDLLFESDLFHFEYPYFSFSDLIATGDTLKYKGTDYAILERVDSIRFQAFCFDSITTRFNEEQYNYLYSNEPYFSIVSKTLSNMSNGIGLFVSGWAASKTMYFEKPASDSLNIYHP